ncbi:hypothetical protein N9D31_03380 [Oligoflexaceae bacterium]|nr:hypothetical protein [Oligoflexaceae bacterium]
MRTLHYILFAFMAGSPAYAQSSGKLINETESAVELGSELSSPEARNRIDQILTADKVNAQPSTRSRQTGAQIRAAAAFLVYYQGYTLRKDDDSFALESGSQTMGPTLGLTKNWKANEGRSWRFDADIFYANQKQHMLRSGVSGGRVKLTQNLLAFGLGFGPQWNVSEWKFIPNSQIAVLFGYGLDFVNQKGETNSDTISALFQRESLQLQWQTAWGSGRQLVFSVLTQGLLTRSDDHAESTRLNIGVSQHLF